MVWAAYIVAVGMPEHTEPANRVAGCARDNIHGKASILDRDDAVILVDQLQDALRHQRRSARGPQGSGPSSYPLPEGRTGEVSPSLRADAGLRH
ncbi:hypothetical protein CJ179_36405 [Rhodococcus sp. ACS1]|nr:hypothetical protein CJ179_36405 [Rhodococcus sp. ACS1]